MFLHTDSNFRGVRHGITITPTPLLPHMLPHRPDGNCLLQTVVIPQLKRVLLPIPLLLLVSRTVHDCVTRWSCGTLWSPSVSRCLILPHTFRRRILTFSFPSIIAQLYIRASATLQQYFCLQSCRSSILGVPNVGSHELQHGQKHQDKATPHLSMCPLKQQVASPFGVHPTVT